MFPSRIFLSVALAVETFAQWNEVFYYGKINCYIRHVKTKTNRLSQNFPEHDCCRTMWHSVASEEDCKTFVKEAHEKAFTEIELKFNETDRRCVMDGLKEKQWFEDVLLESVYKASETLTKSQKNRKAMLAEVYAGMKLNEVSEFCKIKKNLEGIFDEMINDKSEGDERIEDYCLRKYAVDKNLIDTSKINLTLNPRNANVSALNCEEENARSFKKFEEQMVEVTKKVEVNLEAKCVREKFHKPNYIDEFIKVLILSEIKLTEKQKEEAKNYFVKKFGDIDECIAFGEDV